MKKKKRKNRLRILGIIFALSIIVLFITSYIANSLPKQITNYQAQFPVNDRWYHSSILKFSILVPAEYAIDDKQITVMLHNKKGDIIVSRVGTNFDSIETFLNDFQIKNKLEILSKYKLKINELDTLKTSIKYIGGPKNGEITYYLYKNFAIYSLSTSVPTLFSDLDTIAHSFQYIP